MNTTVKGVNVVTLNESALTAIAKEIEDRCRNILDRRDIDVLMIRGMGELGDFTIHVSGGITCIASCERSYVIIEGKRYYYCNPKFVDELSDEVIRLLRLYCKTGRAGGGVIGPCTP